MQDCEAYSASAPVSTNSADESATVSEESYGNKEEASSSPVFIKKVDSREPLASIDLTTSDERALKVSATSSPNPSKSPAETPETPSTFRKYFLRDATNSPKTAVEGEPEDSDEDKEDLVSKLSVFKQLPDGSYSCELCNAKGVKLVMELKTPIVRHVLRAHTYHHGYECSSCPDTFRKESWLRNHTDMAHPQADSAKFFECARCKHRSKDEELLKLHALRSHAAIYRYACKCCAKCFKTWRSKYEHERTTEKGKKKPSRPKPRYVCDKCSVISRTKAELVKHLKKVHSEDFYKNGPKVLYNCKECNKVFMSRKLLRDHTVMHETVENDLTGYACKECGKRLSSKDHLKKHTRVHSGERPYACPECGQAFALRTTMRIHALSHRGIKPYVCRLCDLGYSQRSALMIHWKSKHKNLPPPPPIEIHQYFDNKGKLLIPY